MGSLESNIILQLPKVWPDSLLGLSLILNIENRSHGPSILGFGPFWQLTNVCHLVYNESTLGRVEFSDFTSSGLYLCVGLRPFFLFMLLLLAFPLLLPQLISLFLGRIQPLRITNHDPLWRHNIFPGLIDRLPLIPLFSLI